MKPIIVWDSMVRFTHLPGPSHWILIVAAPVLALFFLARFYEVAADGLVAMLNDRRDREAARANAALRRRQEINERSLRLVGGNWRRG